MHVRMLRARALQDAGVERPLSVGEVYDLPAGVAGALIATGAATAHDEGGDVEVAVVRPPETKPLPRLETEIRERRA